MLMKKTKNVCKRERSHQIPLPKCCQQPRSRASKPRTDFSPFRSSIPSPSHSYSPPNNVAADRRRRHHTCNRDSLLDFSSCKNVLSSITTSVEQGCQAPFTIYKKDMPEFPLSRCSMSQNGEPERIFSNSDGVRVKKVISGAQNTISSTCDNRNDGRHKSDNAETSASTPDKSTSLATRLNDVWITPGSIVWAKTANQMWWPAEIMGERSPLISTNNQDVDGYILVQYYGNYECAWVDPAEDLSQFEDCFDEKSSNSMEAFQDALKQALHKKENLSLCGLLDENPDIQRDQSSDRWNASSSSKTEGDYLERGRGKRKRKPKVHFDEVTFPMKSVKKLRRFKIMRYLGLTAPIGSPFSLAPHLRTSCRIFDI
ncbi:hypothetical protein NE237_005128 [Protea cynaroides]|uniref:PWWP domain-containing protein n=1 Tax=Protea cynaroides TaxID=273540 RepID=A0A9Q0QUB9_9MAGN|nr:hypothetical protein NE237_005128 [Protea cynaroides]